MAFNLCRLHDAAKDPLEPIHFLQGMGLLPGCRACPEREAAMALQVRARAADGYEWRCGVWMTGDVPKWKPLKVQCRGEVSVRSGSFFEGSHLMVPQLMNIICPWCQNLPCAVIQRETDVASKTVTDWTSLCREVVVNAIFTHSEMIGGEGVTTVERKYNRGYLRSGQWVFGGVERGSGRCFLVPVETRDAKTLQGIIVEWVRPGTSIITDCWAGYRKLADDARFTHLTVNHKLNFVDPNTGAHPNTVDATWAHVKTLFYLDGARANISMVTSQSSCFGGERRHAETLIDSSRSSPRPPKSTAPTQTGTFPIVWRMRILTAPVTVSDRLR
ncbi:unnamed protein product [Ixodes hexagonus]